MEDLRLHLYSDADFAGCARTQRSTSGLALLMQGMKTKMPLSAVSKRQTAVSHSTPEAELIAGAYAFRAEGIPQMNLWDMVFGKPIKLYFAEDNEAMIKIRKSGHLRKMRHLSRTHKVNAAFMAEIFREDPNILLDPCKSIDQAADIYTKRFTEPRK